MSTLYYLEVYDTFDQILKSKNYMQPTRIFDFLSYQLSNSPLEKSLGYHHNGNWTYFSTQEVSDLVQKCSNGLLALGVKKGDKIGLIAYKNRPEWLIMDIAIQQVGGIVIPIYPTISSKAVSYTHLTLPTILRV